MKDLIVTHLEDLGGENMTQPVVLVWENICKTPVESAHHLHQEQTGSGEQV